MEEYIKATRTKEGVKVELKGGISTMLALLTAIVVRLSDKAGMPVADTLSLVGAALDEIGGVK